MPERAIAAFERVTSLRVFLHDRRRSLWTYLPPDRFEHTVPLCAMVKHHRERACVAFDVERVHAACDDQRPGLVKVCHAGIVEWVVPVHRDDELEWVLFAGQRRPGPRLTRVMTDSGNRAGPWAPAVAALRPVDDEEAEWILESLRQLAARLALWRDSARAETPTSMDAPSLITPAGRRAEILNFIRGRHTHRVTLSDLARHLRLSQSRTSRVVKEACGATFPTLLNRVRLRTAAGLLRHSDLALRAIAEQSGFGNLAHFHEVFRAAFGVPPNRYRSRSGAGSA